MTRCAALSAIGLAVDVPSPSPLDLALYAFGWLAGWLLLWRQRPLPAAIGAPRDPIAIVVPARNEAETLTHLLDPVVGQLAPGDELLVVDDHSTDATVDAATASGAGVMTAPAFPHDWLGKPHACWHGANAVTVSARLLFVDADVRPPADLLDRVAVALDEHPGSVVSVQPWHTTVRPYEQVGLLCNVAALMGSGAFTALGSRVRPRVAFGPVLAIDRATYDRVGGHGDPTTRRMHTEDIGVARAVGRSQVYTGRPDIAFRMYPNGLRETVRGWTRSIATGARFTPWWAALLVLAWIWSLAGGWLTAPIVYPLSAVQVWVLGRRAGSLHPVTALLYPLAVLGFVVIFLGSLIALITNRQVAWKGRRVDARSAD